MEAATELGFFPSTSLVAPSIFNMRGKGEVSGLTGTLDEESFIKKNKQG